jgi:hypothetical protein
MGSNLVSPRSLGGGTWGKESVGVWGNGGMGEYVPNTFGARPEPFREGSDRGAGFIGRRTADGGRWTADGFSQG